MFKLRHDSRHFPYTYSMRLGSLKVF